MITNNTVRAFILFIQIAQCLIGIIHFLGLCMRLHAALFLSLSKEKASKMTIIII